MTRMIETYVAREPVRFRTVLIVVALCLFAPAVHPQSSFVQVKGTHFVLDGKPYYFAGTNFWYGYYFGTPTPSGNRERLGRELDRVTAAGITNLRILGGSELSGIQNSVKPAIQTAPRVYNDSLMEGLDYLLSEMGKRNMHAVVILNNFWEWSGGMAQYHSWSGGGKVKDPAKDGFSSFTAYSSTFYRNAFACEGFRDYVSDLLTRKNKITGLFYYQDSTIMAWELANEPRPGNDSTYITSFYNWIDSTAQYIHSIDPNHLVTTGNEGTMGSLSSEHVFSRAHQSKFIDYATIHPWALNWGWFNPFNSGMYTSALAKAKSYIQEHLALARELNKPLTMEEFGLPRYLEKYNPGSATTSRDSYYAAVLKMGYDSAAAGSPIAGSNFWGWGGEGRSPNSDYTWRAGDPFVCDPPQEKQGLNSIYDSDSSTISVIRDHAALMEGLGKVVRVVETSWVFDFELYQNYPNPFNPTTVIAYRLEKAANVTLNVYDILGREVTVLVNGAQKAGNHIIRFDGSRLSNGLYWYRLIAGSHSEARSMMLLI